MGPEPTGRNKPAIAEYLTGNPGWDMGALWEQISTRAIL